MRAPSLLVSLSLLLSMSLQPSPSRAQGDDGAQARARELFDAGMAAAQRSDYPAAVEAFEESFALYPHPGTLVNLASFHDQADQPIEALRRWRELLDRFGAVVSEEARARAQQRVATLEGQLAAVELSTAPAGAELLVDGEALGTTPLDEPIYLLPGEHTIGARLSGHDEVTRSVELQPGANPALELRLLRQATSAEGEGEGRLQVQSETEGARVSIDGGQPAPSPASFQLPAGEHEVLVEAPGHISQTREVDLPAGGQLVLAVDLLPLEEAREVEVEGRRGFWRGPWPWIIGGALVVAGAVTAGVLLRPEEEAAADWSLGIR